MRRLIHWSLGLAIFVVRLTCRFRIHEDHRQELSSRGIPHIFAALHAQQIAAMMVAEPGSRIMVSRSNDGEIVVPSLRLLGHVPVRGSAGNRKGGAVALQNMVKSVREGHPGILAVDGPRGPRGQVQMGVGVLAKKSQAAVLAVSVVPRRRWILAKTWDRLQVPQPFTTVDVHVSEPLIVQPGESRENFALRVEASLAALERKHDADEATHSHARVQPSEHAAAA